VIVRNVVPLTRKIEIARRLWDEGRPVAGSPVARYLRSRELTVIPSFDELRFHPGGSSFPEMLAPLRDVGGMITGIHRTRLRSDGTGKADIDKPRLMLGRACGSAIRFGHGTDGLVIVEGVEDALSVVQATGRPCWAAGSATGIRTIVLPAEVRTLVIFADADPIGREAATAAAERLRAEGRRVGIAVPAAGVKDPNEQLRRETRP
jgi:hypothetical protein